MDGDEPASQRARDLTAFLAGAASYPFARLTSCRREEGWDVLGLRVELQLPQRRQVDIRLEEPVEVHFPLDDEEPPRAFAVREDFSVGLPHTNYSKAGDSCWLCLWEESWAELRSVLTPEDFTQRLRGWFERAATDDLHRPGQQLEPLLQATSNTLIVPPSGAGWGPLLHVVQVRESSPLMLDVTSVTDVPAHPDYVVFPVEMPPVVQQAFRQMPRTLADLDRVLSELGRPVLDDFVAWLQSPARLLTLQATPLLLIQFPVLRKAGDEPESYQVRAFTCDGSTEATALAIGALASVVDGEGGVDGGRCPPRPVLFGATIDATAVTLTPWRVVQRLDRRAARHLSGTPGDGEYHITAIGSGAIGSNVVMNCARTGFATWTLIDADIVLPHNTVRQAQTNEALFQDKAVTLSDMANSVLAEGRLSSAIVADVIAPGEEAQRVDEAIARSNAVIDFTASAVALRRLAAMPRARRVASMFFNPAGADLVLLREDAARELRVDEIEAQYFAAVGGDPELAGHLDGGRTDFLRYSNACQDLSRPLPPWQVQTLSGIGARQVLRLEAEADAALRIWRLDVGSGEVRLVQPTLSGVSRADVGDWRVTATDEALRSMLRLRAAQLPNETGGVLVGTIDLCARVVHVVQVLPAPADSRQSPTYFERGTADLRPALDGLAAATAGTLGYLGEWHSHPAGVPARPSRDDENVFAHLSHTIGPTTRPYLMSIVGDYEVWVRLGCRGGIVGEHGFATPPSEADGRVAKWWSVPTGGQGDLRFR